MGGCISVEKKSNSAGKSPARTQSENEDHIAPSTVFTSRNSSVCFTDAGPVYGGDHSIADVASGSQSSPAPVHPDADESFFETRCFLESESEDDYFSVDWDFMHINRHTTNPPCVDEFNGIQDSSPSAKKKKLAELFRESRCSSKFVGEAAAAWTEFECPDKDVDKGKAGTLPCELKLTNDTIYPHSGSSSEHEISIKRAQSMDGLKSVQCCIPGLIPSGSSVNRRRMKNNLHSQNSI